ncbi:MAG: sortase [Clostridia bacterium]
MKKRILDILIVLTIISIIFVSFLMYIKYSRGEKNEKKLSPAIEKIIEIKDEKKEKIYVDGYECIGNIEIEKLNICYPILNSLDEKAMKISIIKFFGGDLNASGNVTLAGHNNLDNKMFGKLNKLIIGDNINIKTTDGKSINYSVYKIDIIDPNNKDITKTINKDIKEITLITCINGNRQRLVVKARESI